MAFISTLAYNDQANFGRNYGLSDNLLSGETNYMNHALAKGWFMYFRDAFYLA